jgi:hypothetical protein
LTVYFVMCTLAVKKNQGRFWHVRSDHSLVSSNLSENIDFHGIPQLLQIIAEVVPWVDHSHFLPISFQFIIPPPIWCYIVSVLKSSLNNTCKKISFKRESWSHYIHKITITFTKITDTLKMLLNVLIKRFIYITVDADRLLKLF